MRSAFLEGGRRGLLSAHLLFVLEMIVVVGFRLVFVESGPGPERRSVAGAVFIESGPGPEGRSVAGAVFVEAGPGPEGRSVAGAFPAVRSRTFGRPLCRGTGLVDLETASGEKLSVEGGKGLVGRFIVHGNESEASGLSRLTVKNDVDVPNFAMQAEEFADFGFCR
jgi:hypothetical protein